MSEIYQKLPIRRFFNGTRFDRSQFSSEVYTVSQVRSNHVNKPYKTDKLYKRRENQATVVTTGKKTLI